MTKKLSAPTRGLLQFCKDNPVAHWNAYKGPGTLVTTSEVRDLKPYPVIHISRMCVI